LECPIVVGGIKASPHDEAAEDKNGIDLLPLNYYRYLLGNISAGKDSLASFLDLLDRGVEKSKIILCHQEVDGRGEAFIR